MDPQKENLRVLKVVDVAAGRSPFVDLSAQALRQAGCELRFASAYPVGEASADAYFYHGFRKFQASELGTGLLYGRIRLRGATDRRYRELSNSIALWKELGRKVGTWRLKPWDDVVLRSREWRCDVIHTHFAWNLPFSVPVARYLGRPLVCTVHGSDIYVEDEWRAWLLDSGVRGVACVSEEMRNYIVTEIPALSKKTRVIHNPINPIYLDPPVSPPRGMRIAIVGNLVPVKNHAWLIRALALLLERGVQFSCTIIGGGPLRQAIRRAIVENELDSVCELAGRLPPEQVKEKIDGATVLALTSRSEGLPNVVIEAAARQRFTVVTDLPGTREATGYGAYGRVVGLDDDAGLADALVDAHRITIEQGDPVRRARDAAVRCFDPREHLRRLLALYRDAQATHSY